MLNINLLNVITILNKTIMDENVLWSKTPEIALKELKTSLSIYYLTRK